MPTTIHIPPSLLSEVDRRAAELKISRNRLIVLVLEREVDSRNRWSRGFFDRLANIDPRDAEAIAAIIPDASP